MANSLMFQSYPVHDGYEDPQLSNFYGQALPLLKRGIPVSTVHIENLSYSKSLEDIKVLVASYSGMKPMEKEAHKHLSEWVKNGGVVIYSARDNDPFQKVQEWWNKDGNSYKSPSEHLFEQMGIKKPYSEGEYKVGKGKLYILRNDPKEFILNSGGDKTYIDTVVKLYNEVSEKEITFKNNFNLERGPYRLISVMEESVDSTPFIAKGNFVDLFDPEIPVLKEKIVNPGRQALLYNLDHISKKDTPQVIATAARVSDEKTDKSNYSFVAKSPVNTTNVMRILLPNKPSNVSVTNANNETVESVSNYDNESKTLFLGFDNSPEGISVKIAF
jgi:hypothetical protein